MILKTTTGPGSTATSATPTTTRNGPTLMIMRGSRIRLPMPHVMPSTAQARCGRNGLASGPMAGRSGVAVGVTVSVSEVVFSSSFDDVDWVVLEAALAADHFDNGRTPQQYQRSHAVVCGCLRPPQRPVRGQRPHPQRRRLQRSYRRHLDRVRIPPPEAPAARSSSRLLATVPGRTWPCSPKTCPPATPRSDSDPQHRGMNQVPRAWLNRT